MESALIIFVKNPEWGKVKTRLAASVGRQAALAIYRLLLEYTHQVVAQVSVRKVVYFSHEIMDDAWEGCEKALQAQGGLGNKMNAAFREQCAKHSKVGIMGTDCANLLPCHIEEAFLQLDTHDFVIGPANDGGYYLLAMRQYEPDVFRQVEWSTSKVLRQTISNIQGLGKSYHLLPELIDVDTWEDWQMVKENFIPS